MDDKTVSLKEVLAEIDAMPPVKAEGHDFIEKTCLKIRLELLPPAQPVNIAKLQPNCNQVASDCISRAAVVDAIDGVDWYHQNENGEMVHGANSAEHQPWYKAEDIYKAIEGVPSAQPGWIPCSECEKRCEKWEHSKI